VAKRLQFATEMMGADAGLHPDQAGRQIGEPRLDLAARPLLAQHDRTVLALTLDNKPAGWGTDSGAGKTIKVWFGDQIRNGTKARERPPDGRSSLSTS
jgi:hypothetical protein